MAAAYESRWCSLPAMNTPQFDWVKSRLPRKAQPVPPIFQPEVAADAIFWAAHHDRRELWVGGPTVQAILADRMAPGLFDHFLARAGYDSQQTAEPEDANRRDNLWQPVPGDHGARGRFGDRAADRSPQLWAATHRGSLTLGALVGIGVGLAAMRLASASRRSSEDDYGRVPDAGLGPKDRAELKHLIER